MLSVEDCKEKLNAPFEEGRGQPVRCYSRREAEAHRRRAYRLFGALLESLREKQSREAKASDAEAST